MEERLKLSHFLTLCVVLSLIIVIPLVANEASEKTEEFVVRYNSPTDGFDYSRAVVVDASGNFYVTGWSEGDYATVKYGSDGNQIWVTQYNGPGNALDYARAITVDELGNVYVTGWSEGSGTSSDYATLKYDADGNQIWAARYNSPADVSDYAWAIATDGSGNVYVTGWSEGSGTSEDSAAVKYDTDGNQVWVARYNGPGNGSDGTSSISIDESGSVYVTGWSEGNGTDSDYATIKYDTDGNQVWVARYNGPGNGYDEASAITVDRLGNVYVTGWSEGSGTGSDYATIKYDTDSNQVWVARYNGPGNDSDRATSIAVDDSGNVYVTGWSQGSETSSDYATVKYDIDGNRVWVARYNGTGNDKDCAYSIAVDNSGNVYVTGESKGSGTGSDYATVKYDTDGNQVWLARYNGTGNDEDRAYDIAVDELKNVYVTGGSIGSGTGPDYVTVKYAEEVEIEMDLPSGWSIVSLPVKSKLPTVAKVFPDAVVMYKYQKGIGYVRVAAGDNLEVGLGYWILFNEPRSYTIRGEKITEYTTSVSDGWYMIGGCTLPAHRTVTTGTIKVIYGFAKDVGYTRLPDASPLEPKNGYWILFINTDEGTIFTASTKVLK